MSTIGDEQGVAAGGESAEITELRTKLSLLKEIQAVQSQIQPQVLVPRTADDPPRTQPVMRTKVPEGSYTMNVAEFRSYRKDIEAYKDLTKLTDRQIVLQIRLSMDADLKRIVDTNYPEWDTLTVEEAINAVGDIVKESSNPVVYRKQFNELIQLKDEPIQEFVTKLRACAIDCAFVCPYDEDHDLTDYHIKNRIMTGIYDDTLQQEILQKHDSLTTVDLLVKYCENFETTKKDRVRLKANNEGNLNSISANEGLTEDEVIAAVSAYRRQKQRTSNNKDQTGDTCSRCGYKHNQKSCPANGQVCLKCGRMNHFSKVCRSTKGKTDPSNLAAAIYKSITPLHRNTLICSSAKKNGLPRLRILVGENCVRVPQYIQAIADTGAEVTVAGAIYLEKLQIKRNHLNYPRDTLKHAAGGKVPFIGSCFLSIEVNSESTIEEVYFVPDITDVFLSIVACKKLKLIHPDFPHHNDAAVDTEEQEELETSSKDVDRGQPGVIKQLAASVGKESYSATLSHHECELPYKPTEENIPLLEAWLMEKFSTVFNTDQYPLPVLKGKPHHIHWAGGKPVAHHSPIPVPAHWKEPVKQILLNDIRYGIIEKVPIGEPVEWCSRMVTVKKKDGNPRITVDYTHLNKQCLRETYPNPRPFDIASTIPLYTYKTTADAYRGYHQILLDKASRKMTTFITEMGMMRNLRSPEGLISSGDAYSARFSKVLIDIPRLKRLVDDTIMYDDNIEEAFHHTYNFLSTCEENSVTLSPRKFKFCRREVEFAGYFLGWDKFYPSSDMVSAIGNFPMPSNPSISDIRAWFGLVNQISPFYATASIMEPFRELLEHKGKDNSKTVYWDSALQKLFEASKQTILEELNKGLTYFDIEKPIIVTTDWSGSGIAFTMQQKHCACEEENTSCCPDGWRVVLCSSKLLKKAENGYAPVEGEALAVAWALKKAKYFLLGAKHFTIQTDHKPLVPILNDKSLESIENGRLLRLKEKVIPYDFTIKHIEGKSNILADTLSRYPVVESLEEDDEFEENFTKELEVASIFAITNSAEALSIDIEKLREASLTDDEYQAVKHKVINNDFAATRSEESKEVKPFYLVKDRLCVSDGLLMYSYNNGELRLVIPRTCRQNVLKTLHSAHQGTDSIARRARETVYWPGLNRDITQICYSCKLCLENAPSLQKEHMIVSPPCEYPFQQVASDLFQKNGYQYLVYVDRYSGWIELEHFKTAPTSNNIITAFRKWFHRFGIPEELSLDGGPNMISQEVLAFFRKWGIRTRQSSAYYPKSNGRAEAAVKTMKRIINGNIGPQGSIHNDRIMRALLQYRNTPLKNINKSPAQILLGRQLRDGIPQQPEKYRINPQWTIISRLREKGMADEKIRSKKYHDSHGVKTYDPITTGQQVACQNTRNKKWDRTGIVIEQRPHRQYIIKLNGSGRISLRNRMHLKPLLHIPPHTPIIPRNNRNTRSAETVSPTTSEESSLHESIPEVPATSRDLPRKSTRQRKAIERYGEWVFS